MGLLLIHPCSFQVTPSPAELATGGIPCPRMIKLVSFCTLLVYVVRHECRVGERGAECKLLSSGVQRRHCGGCVKCTDV